MEVRLTTSQLLKLTGQKPRTLTTWLNKKWLVPYEQGGGKGRQNRFDLFAASWALALNEVFRIWPHADTPVTLFVGKTPDGASLWTPCTTPDGVKVPACVLSDGKRIATHLKELYSRASYRPASLCLSTGYRGFANEIPSADRFGWIHLGPTERIEVLVRNWLKAALPFYHIPPSLFSEPFADGRLLFVRSVTSINLDQYISHVEEMSRYL